jgi:hypothetical protein
MAAHRQSWFETNAVAISASDRRNTETNYRNWDTSPETRWKDAYSSQRSAVAIYDLIDAENVRAREITAAVDANDIELARKLSKEDAPIKNNK